MHCFLSSALGVSHPIMVPRNVEHLMNVFQLHFQNLRSGGDGGFPLGEGAPDSQFVLEWLVVGKLQILVRPVHLKPEFSIVLHSNFGVQHRDTLDLCG